jgi:hypothetical protein
MTGDCGNFRGGCVARSMPRSVSNNGADGGANRTRQNAADGNSRKATAHRPLAIGPTFAGSPGGLAGCIALFTGFGNARSPTRG